MDKKRTRKSAKLRKQEIINVALNLFYEYGYEQVKMEEIAIKSGVAKGLCYYYFPSKEILYQEALDNFVAEIITAYSEVVCNRELSIETRMDQMEQVLKSRVTNNFYKISRQKGNEILFIQVLYKTFQALVPIVAVECQHAFSQTKYTQQEIETFISFIFFGQMGVLVEKNEFFDIQIKQINVLIKELIQDKFINERSNKK